MHFRACVVFKPVFYLIFKVLSNNLVRIQSYKPFYLVNLFIYLLTILLCSLSLIYVV